MGEVFLIWIVLFEEEVGLVFSKNRVEKGFALKSTSLPSTEIISRSSIAP
jgi:hypothetical protein